MDAVYPAAASALARGRRVRRVAPRLRHRTAPVTFAEIKEVDEEKEEAEEASRASVDSVASAAGGGAAGERRRRPDLLGEFTAFRRRRALRQPLREPDEPEPEPEPPAEPGPPAEPEPRAASESRVPSAP